MTAVAAAAVSLAGADAARANGRYPAAGLIALDPSDPLHVVVRATYGLLSTQDGGMTWSWICEQAPGFSDNEDPMVVITKDSTLLVGVFKGLSVSTDRGCGWSFVGGELKDRYTVDLSAEAGAEDHVIAIASNGIGGGKFKTQVFETSDNGKTWAQAGVNLPEDFLGLTIDSAPAMPARLYASGRYGAPEYPGVIQRSDDRGKTWQRFDITGADDKHPPYLAGVDPDNPDLLYVRLDGAETDSLVVSSDGGQTWKTAFEGKAGLLGFALSPDGATVAVGGDKDGLWMAPRSTLEFTKVTDLTVKCLKWTPDLLYACADEFKDGFHVGVSQNQGKTFMAFEHLQQICQSSCPSGSTYAEMCPDRWGVVSLTLGADSCNETPSGGAGGSGGASSSGGAGGATTSGPGDCGCGLAGEGSAGGAMLFAVAAASAGLRRKRRRS